MLTARLRKLEQAGVIERRQYSQRPPRHEDLLTDAGQALRPILLALKEWGDRIRQPRSRAGHLPTHLRRRVPTTDRLRRLNEPVRDGELTVTGGTHPVEATM